MNMVEEAGEENKTALDYSAGYIVVKKKNKKQAQKRVLEHYHLYTKKNLLNVSMCNLFFSQRITPDMGNIENLLRRESDLGGRVTFHTFCTFEFCSK